MELTITVAKPNPRVLSEAEKSKLTDTTWLTVMFAGASDPSDKEPFRQMYSGNVYRTTASTFHLDAGETYFFYSDCESYTPQMTTTFYYQKEAKIGIESFMPKDGKCGKNEALQFTVDEDTVVGIRLESQKPSTQALKSRIIEVRLKNNIRRQPTQIIIYSQATFPYMYHLKAGTEYFITDESGLCQNTPAAMFYLPKDDARINFKVRAVEARPEWSKDSYR